MKRFQLQATFPSDRIDLPTIDVQQVFAGSQVSSCHLKSTGMSQAGQRPGAHILPSEAGLTTVQAERRDELLDRGLPYTWRCSIDGQKLIVREHPGGRLEQLAMVNNGTLVVTRVLKSPRQQRH